MRPPGAEPRGFDGVVGPDSAGSGSVELTLSRVLRIGVIVSFCLILSGTIVSFARHHDYVSSADALRRLTQPGAAPNNLQHLADGLRHGRGQALVLAGLLVLLATPVLRVAISIVAFARERDGVYVVLTSTVLALLALSFLFGKAGG